MPRLPSDRKWSGEELGERHRDVLRVGLELIAERGYTGASLRELARRVGMQQPSLYHYFRSKEEMVEQILQVFGFGGMYSIPSGIVLPDRVEDLPAMLRDTVVGLYERTTWPLFVRAMFNLALEQERYGARLKRLLIDRVDELFTELLAAYVDQGQIDAREARWMTRMVLNAISLCYIEQKLLFPGRGVHQDMAEYADYVVRVAEGALGAANSSSRVRKQRKDGKTK